jgi:hypothetical protein
MYGFNHGTSRTDVFIMDQPLTSEGIRLCEDVWVGANAVILDGVEIGPHCVIAAGAVVTKSFGAYLVIAGNPAGAVADRRIQRENQHSDPLVSRRLGVRDLLFARDPYSNPEHSFPPDFQGWGSEDLIFRTIFEAFRPKLIVEIGTWKGASAIHMAGLCREFAIEGEIVCIDTWLGNWQHWVREEGVGSKEDLRISNGLPRLYFQFLSNVIATNHSDIITPFPITSIAGAKFFNHHALCPDFLYVDADHEYESVVLDLRAWLPLMSQRGVLVGDDYGWPGVRDAVEEIAAEGIWVAEVSGNKFMFRRR